MNLDKLTVRSQEALREAQQSAAALGHPDISPEHLLQALLNQEGGLAPILLQRIGLDVPRLKARVRKSQHGQPSSDVVLEMHS